MHHLRHLVHDKHSRMNQLSSQSSDVISMLTGTESPHLDSPHPTSPHLTRTRPDLPHLTSPHLTQSLHAYCLILSMFSRNQFLPGQSGLSKCVHLPLNAQSRQVFVHSSLPCVAQPGNIGLFLLCRLSCCRQPPPLRRYHVSQVALQRCPSSNRMIAGLARFRCLLLLPQ